MANVKIETITKWINNNKDKRSRYTSTLTKYIAILGYLDSEHNTYEKRIEEYKNVIADLTVSIDEDIQLLKEEFDFEETK